MRICHACRKELSFEMKVGRKDTCPACGVDLRCCLNCKLHDQTISKQCKEPAADLIREKTKANFCDYFVFAATRQTGAAGEQVDAARKALDSLFKH